MKTRFMTILGIILLAAQLVLADGSFQSTSQVTGGMLIEQFKSNPFTANLTKSLSAPTNTLTMVHGNLKAVVTKDSTEIVDLDKETITRIDTVKKTYSVATFAQVRQAMANMPAQMAQAQAQAQAQMKQLQAQQAKSDLTTSFDVSVQDPGVTKVVNGLNAQEHVITVQMHVTDPKAPASVGGGTATYVVTTDVWIAPDPPEVKEIQDFDLRMGQKMMAGVDMSAFAGRVGGSGSAGMAALFGGRPGASEAWAQMGKEMAKLKGTHVLEVTSMGGNGPAAPAGASARAAAGGQTPASATLMQMTMQKSNFSREAIPSSVFEVPSGYTKVPSPYDRMGK